MVNFEQCRDKFQAGLLSDYATYSQYIFTGTPFRIPKNTSSQVSYTGCVALCGKGAQYYDFSIISNTITTWVLPIIGILLQGPFEPNQTWETVLDICRWVGSPIASLSYILWNIRVIGKCAMMVDMSTKIDEPWSLAKVRRRGAWARNLRKQGRAREAKEEEVRIEHAKLVRGRYEEIRNSLYILQAMNQYTMRSLKPKNMAGADYSATSAEGLLRIALFSEDLELKVHCDCQDHDRYLRPARQKLAEMLRNRRKRGIIPVFISMFWFLVSLALSIQSAFTGLGVNSTAHDLATGLLLGWLPVLILCCIADRNPTDEEGNRDDLNKFISSVCVSLLDDKIFERYVAECKGKYEFPDHYGDIEEGLQQIRKLCKALLTVDNDDAPSIPPLKATSALNLRLDSIPDEDEDAGESPNAGHCTRPMIDEIPPEDETERSCMFPEIKFFGSFAGQGRLRWHYGAAHPILSEIEHAYLGGDKLPGGRQLPGKRNWLKNYDKARVNIVLGKLYERKGLIWWDFRELWQILGAVLTVCGTAFGAFIISYNTPTIGLGCRSGSFLIFMVNSLGLFLIEMLTWRMDWRGLSDWSRKPFALLHSICRLGRRRRSLYGHTVEGSGENTAPTDEQPAEDSTKHKIRPNITAKDSFDMLDWSSVRRTRPRTFSDSTSGISPTTSRDEMHRQSLLSDVFATDFATLGSSGSVTPETRGPMDEPVRRPSQDDDTAYEVFDPIGRRKYVGYVLRLGEAVNAAFLIGVVAAQAVGGFDTCLCMTSLWGLESGAYLDFNDLTIARPNVIELPWIWGTVVGSLAMFAGLVYVVAEWLLASHMSTINTKDSDDGLRRVRRWRKSTLVIRRTREAIIDSVSVLSIWLYTTIWSALSQQPVIWVHQRKMRWSAVEVPDRPSNDDLEPGKIRMVYRRDTIVPYKHKPSRPLMPRFTFSRVSRERTASTTQSD